MFLLIVSIVTSYTEIFANGDVVTDDIEDYIEKTIKKSKIPGLSIVIIDRDNTYIKSFGYADVKNKVEVTPNTKFELASCSKAFTALALLKLEEERLINLSDPVSKYLTWFYVEYEGEKHDITIEQVMHHTSGIPTETISNLTQSTDDNALKDAVKSLVGIKLDNRPGTVFQYASINYDILGAIIEEVSNMSYEDHMTKKVLRPLGLNNTTVGINRQDLLKSKGYKISFFKPREYDSPNFRGNNPAGYIVSDAEDIAKWLKL